MDRFSILTNYKFKRSDTMVINPLISFSRLSLFFGITRRLDYVCVDDAKVHVEDSLPPYIVEIEESKYVYYLWGKFKIWTKDL